jgi:ribosomal protein RSM22 (predicted rRNA methylase)
MNMTTQGEFIYDDAMTLAYLLEYFPSLYAINLRIMTEIRKRIIDFHPKRVLDFGCGPGSASMAIIDTWPDSIDEILGIDTSDSMLEVARRLNNDGNPRFKEDQYVLQKYLPLSLHPTYDLVVASYSLNEFRNDSLRSKALENLWSLTKDILVLVQPGTVAGFRQLQQAREWVLAQKIAITTAEPMTTMAHTVAPCPHDKPCPLLEKNSWCHFAQRSERTQPQLEVHGGFLNYLDERYSYIVLRRGPRPQMEGKHRYSQIRNHIVWPPIGFPVPG